MYKFKIYSLHAGIISLDPSSLSCIWKKKKKKKKKKENHQNQRHYTFKTDLFYDFFSGFYVIKLETFFSQLSNIFVSVQMNSKILREITIL